MKYTVVIEKTESSYGSYVPDLPGRVAVGETREEVTQLSKEAIEFRIEGIKLDGLEIPQPTTTSELVEISAS
ncbi:MAG: type II toxin-antitoxin system HicB family antitoxin [Bacteroidota bacterium]|nr:type II toxin-antitoxin system HicB family antitoxin [Bacteroidota bacterium]